MYAYMIVRMMRACVRARMGLSAVCMYVCMYVCLYVCFYICIRVRSCVCVYVQRMSLTFFLTSNLLHLESNIYVCLLAYMRTHARQHLKLEVRHKNSHARIHTHILNGQTHAHTCMHTCTYTQTHIYTQTHKIGCTYAHIYI